MFPQPIDNINKVIEGSRMETLDLDFALFDFSHKGTPEILSDLMLSSGDELTSHNFAKSTDWHGNDRQ